MESSKKLTLVRTHAIRKERTPTVVPAAAKKRIAEEAYYRASSFDDQYFEKMKKVTISKDNDNSVREIVLDKLRQKSISIRKDSTAVACRKLDTNLFKDSPVADVDLFRESIGSVLNRLGRGDTAYDDQELFHYLKTAFSKSKSETDLLISEIKEEKIATHFLHTSVNSAKLKHKPKNTTFCSVTLLHNENSINFARCDESNTKMTMMCGTQVPLWDYTTSFPLETAKGCILAVAVWETKSLATFDIVNNDKRCLGLVELHLDAQPEGGSDDWYQLKSRKNDKEKGSINIVVKFRVDVDHEPEHSVTVHTKLLSKFLSCDYDSGAKGLQPTSAYILELHKTQKGLTSEERWLSEWTVRNTLYLKINSDYGMLYAVLNKVLYPLNNATSELKPHQKSDLMKSFAGFIEQALEKYKNVVAEFPYTDAESINSLINLNQCVNSIIKCKAFHDTINTKEKICEAITSSVQLGYASYCNETEEDKKTSDKSIIDRIKMLTTKAKSIHLELSNENEAYPKVFTVLDIDFMSITLHEIDNLLSVELVREISEVIKSMKTTEPEEDLMNATLYLYVCVSEIKKQFVSMVSAEEEFTLLQYHSWFYNPIETWLKIIRMKQRARVSKAVELDKLYQCDDFVKYSTSVIDVETMNIELGDIYKIFDFPDESSAFSVVSKLTEQMCDSMVMLSAKLEERASIIISSKPKKLAKDNQAKETGLLETLCIVLNSMEQGMDTFTRLPSIMNFGQFNNQKNIEVLHKTIEDSNHLIKVKKAEILHYMCDLMQPKFDEAFKDYLKSLHGSEGLYEWLLVLLQGTPSKELEWCGEKTDSLEALYSTIIDELSMVFEWVNHTIFLKVISSLWSRVIQPRFLQQIELRPLKKNEFYIELQNGFTNLAQFFVDEVPELKASIQGTDRFSHLSHVFELLTNPIQDLLFRFYDEEAIEQRSQNSELGQAHISAHFTTPSKNDTTLKVIITRCVSLPKMDIAALCDAVVHVLVQPIGAINFSHIKQRKTNCIKNNINPEFNQSFDIPLHIEDINLAGACLQLTVWDKDTFSADDLIGEILLPLRDIPSQVPKEFICPIKLPTGTRTPCYDVISHRAPYDRHAANFIKSRQYLEKCFGKRSG